MTVLAAQYELEQYKTLEKLDKKGKVRLARDIRDNSLWVIKTISESAAEIYKRIVGISCESLPYIRNVLGTDGNYYVIEKYVEGSELIKIIEEKRNLPVYMVTYIMKDICDAMHILHSKGIIHRDITPSNIIIKNNGRAMLIDMGISRIKKKDTTHDTHVLGTAGYAAPEQFGFAQTDVTADIYACGVIMNVMLTGKLPTDEKYRGRLDYIIDRCINIDPKERYHSAGELKAALIRSEGIMGRAINCFGRLPGFGGGGFEKAAAVVVYTTAAFFFAVAVLSLAILGSKDDFVIYSMFSIFVVLMPFFIASNYLGFIDRMSFTKNLSKRFRQIICYMLAFCEFTVSLFLFLYFFEM